MNARVRLAAVLVTISSMHFRADAASLRKAKRFATKNAARQPAIIQ